MRALEAYDWPGNVRELKNAVEKMVVLSEGDRLVLDDVPYEIAHALKARPESAVYTAAPQRGINIKEMEKAKILSTLERFRYNKTRAAEELGISRRTLHRKLNEWKS